MATERAYQDLLDRLNALRAEVVRLNAGDIAVNPALADQIQQQIDEQQTQALKDDMNSEQPEDGGLARLTGIGEGATRDFGETRMPQGVVAYDEQVVSERMIAIGDLYYIYQHEKIGVFRVMSKLKELFHAGAVRLSSGPGAFGLYQFDRRDVLRFTRRERHAAFRRAFGYGSSDLMPGATPNADFHRMFSHFINQVALFWRDKRISDVVRERAYDPSFGSIAIVRRAGLDLRNNLKFTSFGHLNVMRVEVMQLLEESFRILGSPDIKNLFGVDTAWDVVEEVLVRYFNERLHTSPRQAMGRHGRELLRWLAQGNILGGARVNFEAQLLQIAEPAEEWLTSAQSLGLAQRSDQNRVTAWSAAGPIEKPAVSRMGALRPSLS